MSFLAVSNGCRVEWKRAYKSSAEMSCNLIISSALAFFSGFFKIFFAYM